MSQLQGTTSPVHQRSSQSWSAQYMRLPFRSVLETGNSVGRLRRSLLVSRMLGASPTVPITNTVVAGEVEHLLGQLEPLAEAELGQAQLALPVEVALPLLGRLDAGQVAAVVGQLAFAALDQPARLLPFVVDAGRRRPPAAVGMGFIRALTV